MVFDKLNHLFHLIAETEIAVIVSPFGQVIEGRPNRRFLRVAFFAEKNHRADVLEGRVVILSRVLKDLLSRACTPRRKDDAMLRDRQEPVLTNAV